MGGAARHPLVYLERSALACPERPVLCRGGDLIAHGQVGQEGLDFSGAHASGMSLAVMENVGLDPADVSLFRPIGVALPPDAAADSIEKRIRATPIRRLPNRRRKRRRVGP